MPGPDGKPIDQKWSMTMFARDVDTGIAKWAYQMTPFDEWDYDGINEPILATLDIKGEKRKVAVHFDRNGFAYTLDRVTGEPLVAEKYDPVVNWATKVDLDKSSPNYGRPIRVKKYSTFANGADFNTKGICPAALGSKDQQPASFSPLTKAVLRSDEPRLHGLRTVQGLVHGWSALRRRHAVDVPGPDKPERMGNFIAWDATTGKIVWSKPEQFSVWSGALTTAGGVAFYGTLEGYFKAVDQKTGKELFKFKTPSGIIGNAMTYMSMVASSTSPCSRALVVGPVSVSPLA